MQYMQERGVLAMTPGEAIDIFIRETNLVMHKVYSFKCWVSKPDELKDFSHDALILNAIGSELSVQDLWKRKHGE